MKHRKCPDPVVLYVLLAAACLGLAVPVAVLDARWLILPAALLVLAAVLLAFHIRRLRRFVAVNPGRAQLCGQQDAGQPGPRCRCRSCCSATGS